MQWMIWNKVSLVRKFFKRRRKTSRCKTCNVEAMLNFNKDGYLSLDRKVGHGTLFWVGHFSAAKVQRTWIAKIAKIVGTKLCSTSTWFARQKVTVRSTSPTKNNWWENITNVFYSSGPDDYHIVAIIFFKFL